MTHCLKGYLLSVTTLRGADQIQTTLLVNTLQRPAKIGTRFDQYCGNSQGQCQPKTNAVLCSEG